MTLSASTGTSSSQQVVTTAEPFQPPTLALVTTPPQCYGVVEACADHHNHHSPTCCASSPFLKPWTDYIPLLESRQPEWKRLGREAGPRRWMTGASYVPVHVPAELTLQLKEQHSLWRGTGGLLLRTLLMALTSQTAGFIPPMCITPVV
ncbi:hypothetical protein CRENBAI_019037 [Crenichthys baileyi]|uniref:Uncharacterized protein n=1 Tax=Crenichthys baileyi TaxID=28760 RepID=A0AAV9RQY1_9TELE